MKLPVMAENNAERVWKTMAWATCDGEVPAMKAQVHACATYECLNMETTSGFHNTGVVWDTAMARWAGEGSQLLVDSLMGSQFMFLESRALLAKIEFCELHLHISTWPLAIVAGSGEGEAPSLGMQEDARLRRGKGARNWWETRSGDRDRGEGKSRKQQAQAPTEEARQLESRRARRRRLRWRTNPLKKGSVFGWKTCVSLKNLNRKKGSLRENYKSQTEVNDKVWSLNLETEKSDGRALQTETFAKSTRSLTLSSRRWRTLWERRWRLKGWRILLRLNEGLGRGGKALSLL